MSSGVARDRARSASDGWVLVGGVRVAVRDHGGDGPGLVLLHGVGGNLETMDPLAERFGGHRVIAFDLPGCGWSGRIGDLDTDPIGTMADALHGVILHFGLDAPDLLGHSLGGMVAARYAARHGEANGGGRLVSIDGFPPGHLTVADTDGQAVHQAWLVGARRELEQMTEAPVVQDAAERQRQAAGMRGWLTASRMDLPNLDAVIDRQFLARGDGTSLRRPDRAIISGAFARDVDVLADYRATTAPTLIIRCTEWAPPPIDEDLADLAKSRPGVDVIAFAGSHLSPAWERVDDAAAVVEEFWARHPRPGDGRS
jgi:pimeloyl-ACP methyl ester carboxylesterase